MSFLSLYQKSRFKSMHIKQNIKQKDTFVKK